MLEDLCGLSDQRYGLLELSFSLEMEYDALVKLVGIVYSIKEGEQYYDLYRRIRSYLDVQPLHMGYNFLYGGDDETFILTNLHYLDMQLHLFNFSKYNRKVISKFMKSVNSYGVIDTLFSRLEEYLEENA
ncbi:hypothetical protein J6Z48_00035 [bacterium]|nr:hypothetical protein [bacterium]